MTMILITGAAGKTGRAITRVLAQRNARVRALVRKPDQATVARAAGATEVLVGDIADDASVRQALAGVRRVYHICPNMHPHEISVGKRMIGAAQEAGVEHFVFHSVLHPQTEAMPHHWQKLRVEEALFESGLPFTILQPAAYMQNLLAHRRQILDEGVFAVPYAPSARISLVDLADVATAAAIVLTESGHVGAIYELSGTGPLSQTDVADIIHAHIGRAVSAISVERAQWQAQTRATGLNDYAIATLLQMFDYYERFGLVGNPNVLGWLLRRLPVSLAEFVAREF